MIKPANSRHFICALATFVVSAALAASCLALLPARADVSARWRHLTFAAEQAEQDGRNQEAKRYLLEALRLAEKLGTDHPFYSLSLRGLGRWYFEREGNLSKAEHYFREELSVLEPLGKTYPDKA